jgi:hypothetical protein
MMHRRFRRMAALALYGELSEKEEARFQRHIAHCADCAGWLDRTRQTLLAARAFPPEPAGLHTRILGALEEEIRTASLRAGTKPARRRSFAVPVPRYALIAGAAVLLLAAGYVVGRLTTSTPAPLESLGLQGEGERFTAAQAQRVDDYLDRSRTLLIGIVNMPAGAGRGGTRKLAVESAVSRKLVSEARSLQEELRSPQAARTRQLVAELELVLLQIANLEKNQNDAGLRLIREGVERGGIMLRITIERMDLDERQAGTKAPASLLDT